MGDNTINLRALVDQARQQTAGPRAFQLIPPGASWSAPETQAPLLPYTMRRAPAMTEEDQREALDTIVRKLAPAAGIAAAGALIGMPEAGAIDAFTQFLPENLQGMFQLGAAGVGRATPWARAQEGPEPVWEPGRPLDLTARVRERTPQLEEAQRMMEDQVRRQLGVIPPDAPPEVKLQRLIVLGSQELGEQLRKPSTESGIDWYDGDQRLARQLNQEAFPELADNSTHAFHTAISAAMSNSQTPRDEVNTANRIWETYRNTGRIPLFQPDGETQWRAQGAMKQLIKLQRMRDDMGSDRAVADWLRSAQTVADIRQYRPGQPGTQSDVVPGALVLGPKIGRYYMDLLGIPHEGSTVDLWDVRGNQRRLGNLFDANGNAIEAPSERDRDVFMELHRQLADQHDLQRKQAQSALWHYEQDLYRRLGLNAPSFKRSDGARAYLESIGLGR